jgi:hypothetical protein
METLFVNAAIEGDVPDDQHLPWVVEIELPRAKEESATSPSKKRKRSDDDNDSEELSKRVCASD